MDIESEIKNVFVFSLSYKLREKFEENKNLNKFLTGINEHL